MYYCKAIPLLSDESREFFENTKIVERLLQE